MQTQWIANTMNKTALAEKTAAHVMENQITVLTPLNGPDSLSIPVTFNTMLVMLGRVPVIHFTLPFDSGFAKLCAIMEHNGNKRNLSAYQCARAIRRNKRIDSRFKVPVVANATYIKTFKAAHIFSQEECVKAGAETLITLFALADAHGITSHHRASSYLSNLGACKFNECLQEVFARAVAVAIAHYSTEVKEFADHLDKLAKGYMCDDLDCDRPTLVPLDAPHNEQTSPLDSVVMESDRNGKESKALYLPIKA